MIKQIYAALAGVSAFVAVLIGVFYKGKRSEAKEQEEARKDEYIETVKKINDAKKDVDSQSDDNITNELRDKYVKR